MLSETEAEKILKRLCINAPWTVARAGTDRRDVISSWQIERLYDLMRSGKTFNKASNDVSLFGDREKDRAAQLLRKAGLIEYRYPRISDDGASATIAGTGGGGGGPSSSPDASYTSVNGMPVSGANGGGSSPAVSTRTRPRGKKDWFVV